MDLEKLFLDPLKSMFANIAEYLPKIFGGLFILLVGLLVARLIRRLVQKLLDTIGFDKMSEKAGIEKALAHGGIKTTASKILSGLVFWLAVIMVIVMIVDQLELDAARAMLSKLTDYLPLVIGAVFVLVLGMFLSVFIHGVVTTAASNAHIPHAKTIGSISRYAIIIFAFVIALGQLQIGAKLITELFKTFFQGLCLALALAFGLGCKDIAAQYLKDFFKAKETPRGE